MDKTRLALLNRLTSQTLIMRPDSAQALVNYLMTDDKASFASSIGKEWGAKASTITSKVAIVSVHGVLMKNPSDEEKWYYGAISTDDIKTQIESLQNNPEIDAMVLHIDSPGGIIIGPPDLADSIYKTSDNKPLLVHTSGQMCSGAMWVGAAAQIRTAFPVSYIGSIGVWSEHWDTSKFYENIGVKKTMISRGRNKVRGADGYPLSEEDLAYRQKEMDKSYEQFTSAMSLYLGIPQKKIVDVIGADVYMAEQALELGLITKIATLEETIEMAAQLATGGVIQGKDKEAVAVLHTEDKSLKIPDKGYTKEVQIMDKKTLKEQHPDLYTAVIAEGRAEVEQTLVTVTAEAGALKVENQSLKASNEKLSQEKTALDKDLAIEKANSLAEKAEMKASAIMTTLLSDSSISETLHVKVKAMVKHQDYIKDGAFDEQAFTAAFKTEVADWETKVPAGAGLGVGDPKKDELTVKGGDEEANIDYGKELARSFAGKIRSDEK